MKHKDGIECYLKPGGTKHHERKFREITQETESDDDLLMHSVVLKTSSNFNVAIRFSDTFDMSSASALHVITGLSKTNGEQSLESRLASIYRVRSGVALVEKANSGHSFDGWRSDVFAQSYTATFTRYNLDLFPGDVTISVTRGHPTWADGKHKDHAGGPEGQSMYYGTSFRPLPGDMGVPYIFRFTPQSTDLYRETSERCHVSLPTPPRVTSDAYIEDADFSADYQSSLSFLQDIRVKGWDRDRNEHEAARLRRKNLVAPEALPTSNKDAQLDDGAQEASSSRQARPIASVEPQSNNELRAVPICSCPKTHPAKAGKSATLKIATPAERNGSAGRRRTQQSLADGPRSPNPDDTATADATVKARNSAQETVAKQCMSCKKFKAPASGKKITYRKARGKYMCVPRNAHEEAGPVDTVLRRTVSETEAPTRPTSEPDLPLAAGIDEDSTSSTAASVITPEQEISQSETSQSASEEPTVEPPNSQSPVATGLHNTEEDETSLDDPSITATESTTVASTEAPNQPASNKRPAEPSEEQPPAKQPRIEESITTDDENQTVSIKTEPDADPDIQFAASQEPTKTRREKRLEEDLARKQAELREIKLEREIKELQRQLAEEQRRKQNARPLIKVKQEIIELD